MSVPSLALLDEGGEQQMRTEKEMTYEAPVILDVAELTGTFAGDCGVCITGGGAAHEL